MRRIALYFVCLSIFACSDDKKNDDDGNQNANEGTLVGASGGAVVSDDGALTLTVPAGALSADTRISIAALGADAAEARFEGATVAAVYEFVPGGLTFNVPAVVTAVLPSILVAEGENVRVPFAIATTTGDGKAEANLRQEIDVDVSAGSAIHTTELSHFSQVQYHVLSVTGGMAIVVEPPPPSTAKVGQNYGTAVRFAAGGFFDKDFEVYYDDESTGPLVHSSGGAPFLLKSYDVGGIVAIEERLTAGTYACNAVGSADYAVHLYTERFGWNPFPVLLEHTCDPKKELDGDCSPGDQGDLLPTWPAGELGLNYSVRVRRDVVCQPADVVNPPMGPPYSGLVQYQGWNYTDGNWPGVTAVFSGGGEEQTRFDAYVNMIQSRYGIMANRGAIGTCRPLQIFMYDSDFGMIPTTFDPSLIPAPLHVGVDGNDAVVAKFPQEVSATFEPEWNIYRGPYVSTLPAITPAGIAIHVPADAAAPAITLPGLAAGATSAITFTPNVSDIPTDGVDLTWQADELDAEFMHIIVSGEGDLGFAAYECFVEPSTQLFTVEQALIDDLMDATWNGSQSNAHSIDIQVMLAKRREASYLGRTLLGFFVRDVSLTTYTCGEAGSC